MTTKKENVAETVAPTYTKQQFLSAKRFAGHSDLLNALLDDDQIYTMEQVEKLLEDFIKKEVS